MLVNPRYATVVYTAAAAVILALAASCWATSTTVLVASRVMLLGVAYGIANDLLACHECIEYFTVGHVNDGRRLEKRLVLTLDPCINALVWGAVATWHVSLAAGCLLAWTRPEVDMRALVGAALLVLVLAHVASRFAIQAPSAVVYPECRTNIYPAWTACSVRNGTGYVLFALVALGISLGRDK
jgi:hypothetical protein